MTKVYESPDAMQVYLLRDLLEDAGIATAILNENLRNVMGEVPFFLTQPQLWITDDQQAELAGELIADQQRRMQQADQGARAERPCSHCGQQVPANFDLCWSCGRQMTRAT